MKMKQNNENTLGGDWLSLRLRLQSARGITRWWKYKKLESNTFSIQRNPNCSFLPIRSTGNIMAIWSSRVWFLDSTTHSILSLEMASMWCFLVLLQICLQKQGRRAVLAWMWTNQCGCLIVVRVPWRISKRALWNLQIYQKYSLHICMETMFWGCRVCWSLWTIWTERKALKTKLRCILIIGRRIVVDMVQRGLRSIWPLRSSVWMCPTCFRTL